MYIVHNCYTTDVQMWTSGVRMWTLGVQMWTQMQDCPQKRENTVFFEDLKVNTDQICYTRFLGPEKKLHSGPLPPYGVLVVACYPTLR